MVGGKGLEPLLSCENQILSLARLPVPPLAHNYTEIYFSTHNCTTKHYFREDKNITKLHAFRHLYVIIINMDTNDGGSSFSPQRESAAEAARRKVLAVYSSTLESLKQNPTSNQDQFTRTSNGNEYITPPIPTSDYDSYALLDDDDSSIAGNDYEQINHYNTSQTSTHIPSADAASALKNAPINQTIINDEWKQYHSAWQNYYQNYYNDYYSKAAQNYLATEKLKSERVATGNVQKKRRTRRLLPLVMGLLTVGVFLFLQYNRLIFAPIMAYVSPDTGDVNTSIEAIDPSITQAVSPEPRLIIPKLNIDVPVAFNISTNDVMEAMNHGVAQFSIPGANALPGQVGNLVISGHSAGDIYSSNPYKFIFSGLERLSEGDLIYVNYNSVRYTYRMTKSEVVEPSDVAALIYPTQKPVITLITCTPLGTSRYRLLITGEQISPEFDYNEGEGIPDEGITNPVTPSDSEMPANEPSFFENLWNGIFGS